MNYNDLRHFADSYGLAVLLVVYLVFVGWAFRPGARARNQEAATMIFAEDDEMACRIEEKRHG